ncbi:hypothetical protein BDP27DRAFT_1333421, partial [Rhodocollybia butyracea]
DADVIIRSCDNVDFCLHKQNLHFSFQFVYPQRHPSLDRLECDGLIELAEAAEKYEVYGALTACHLTLRLGVLYSHSKVVLKFACRHQVAPLEALTSCPQYFFEWSIFREQYLQLAIALAQSRPPHQCENFSNFTRSSCKKLNRPSNLMMSNLENLFNIRSIGGLENIKVCCLQESRMWYHNAGFSLSTNDHALHDPE